MFPLKSLPKINQIQPQFELLLLVHYWDDLSETAEAIGLIMFYHVHQFSHFSPFGCVSDHHPLKSLAWTFSLVSAYFTSSWVSICKRFSSVSGFTSLIGSEISVAALSSFIAPFTGIWDSWHGPKPYPSICLINVIPSSSLIPATFPQSLSPKQLSAARAAGETRRSRPNSWSSTKSTLSVHSQTSLENTEGKSSFLRVDAHSCKSLPSRTPRVLQLFAGRTTACSFREKLFLWQQQRWIWTSDGGLRCCPALSSYTNPTERGAIREKRGFELQQHTNSFLYF